MATLFDFKADTWTNAFIKGAIIIAIGVFLIWYFHSPDKPEPIKTQNEKLLDASYNSIYNLDECAKTNLKYPLTATFEEEYAIDYTDDSTGVVISRKGRCTNGFGVPMAFHYTALIKKAGIDSFKIASFKFHDY